MKIQKKIVGVVSEGGSGWVGGQGGCERRIDVFVKIQEKWRGRGRVWGVGLGGQGRCNRVVRVDVNEELKFLGKLKKNGGGGRGGVGSGRGVGWGSQGGCERRIDVFFFVKIQKKKLRGGVGSGGSGLGVRVDVSEK